MQIISRRDVFRAMAAVALACSATLAGLGASAAEPSPPVAIKGYDPVAYFTAGKPTQGRADITHVWDDHRYQFSTPENRDRFKADPVRYAPQFHDYCAMALSKGMIVEADPQNWTIAENKLYIFGKPVGPELFKQDVSANKAKAEGNRKILPQRKS